MKTQAKAGDEAMPETTQLTLPVLGDEGKTKYLCSQCRLLSGQSRGVPTCTGKSIAWGTLLE